MQVEFSVKILEMAMTIDEARQHCLSSDIDYLRAGRNLAEPTDGLKAAFADDDHAIVSWWAASTIDQRSSLDHQRLFRHSPIPYETSAH